MVRSECRIDPNSQYAQPTGPSRDPPLVTSWEGGDDPSNPQKETALAHAQWGHDIHMSPPCAPIVRPEGPTPPADPYRRAEFEQRFPPLGHRRQHGRTAGTSSTSNIVVVHHVAEPQARLQPEHRPLDLEKYHVPEDSFFHPFLPTYFAPWDEGNNIHELYEHTCALAETKAAVEAENQVLHAAVQEDQIQRLCTARAREAELLLVRQLQEETHAAKAEEARFLACQAEQLNAQWVAAHGAPGTSRNLRAVEPGNTKPAAVYRSKVRDHRAAVNGQLNMRARTLQRWG